MDNHNVYNEKELLVQIATGDQSAFTQLIGHYTPIIYRHLLTYSKDAARSEETTQDILLTIWSNREKLANMENFAGYVYIITRNRATAIFREKLNTTVPVEDRLQHLIEDPSNDFELKELTQILHRGIELLPEKRREAFKLSRYEQLSYEEIAERLSISRSTVRQHIIASLVFLRTYLKQETGIVISTLTWMAVTGS